MKPKEGGGAGEGGGGADEDGGGELVDSLAGVTEAGVASGKGRGRPESLES